MMMFFTTPSFSATFIEAMRPQRQIVYNTLNKVEEQFRSNGKGMRLSPNQNSLVRYIITAIYRNDVSLALR